MSCSLRISVDVGHVLAHYLFTGTYQCLKPIGLFPSENDAAEFATGVRVYAFAREYELLSLEELAKREIEKLGCDLPFSLVLDLLERAYRDPVGDDAWLNNYLKSGFKRLLQDPVNLSDFGLPLPGSRVSSVSNLIVKNLVDVVRENIMHQGLDTAPPAHVPAFVVPAPELGRWGDPALAPDHTSETSEPDLSKEKKSRPSTQPLLGPEEKIGRKRRHH